MKYIVTLASYGHRVEKTAPYAVRSLLKQTVCPDKIVLWLPHNTHIPVMLKDIPELEIRFCKDLKSYNKLIHSLREFPNDILVTADNDVVYPERWFEQLKKAHLKQPTYIHVHRAHRILIDSDKNIIPYKDWQYCIDKAFDESTIFPTGTGGILYPPNSLHSTCTDERSFLSLAPSNDDIWFWAMARLNTTKYSIVKDGYRNTRSIDYSNKNLWQSNISYGLNDKQLLSVLEHFPLLKKPFDKPSKNATTRKKQAGKVAISVIMPCYNTESYVGEAIESILKQTFDDFELIIVNDGSTDNSEEKILKYTPDSRIQYLPLTKNKGNYAARNIGLKVARGRYIAIFDADDVADPNRLLLQYEYLETHKNIGAVGSQGYFIDNRGAILGDLNKPIDIRHFNVALLKDNVILHPSLMFRMSALKKYNLTYNEEYTYSADYDLVTRAAQKFKITNLKERLIKYRVHPRQISITRSTRQTKFADAIRLNQLKQLKVILSEQDVLLYLAIMREESLTKFQIKQCVSIFNKIVDENNQIKFFGARPLFYFLKSILGIAYCKMKQDE